MRPLDEVLHPAGAVNNIRPSRGGHWKVPHHRSRVRAEDFFGHMNADPLPHSFRLTLLIVLGADREHDKYCPSSTWSRSPSLQVLPFSQTPVSCAQLQFLYLQPPQPQLNRPRLQPAYHPSIPLGSIHHGRLRNATTETVRRTFFAVPLHSFFLVSPCI